MRQEYPALPSCLHLESPILTLLLESFLATYVGCCSLLGSGDPTRKDLQYMMTLIKCTNFSVREIYQLFYKWSTKQDFSFSTLCSLLLPPSLSYVGPLSSFHTTPPFSWAPQAPQQAASTLTRAFSLPLYSFACSSHPPCFMSLDLFPGKFYAFKMFPHSLSVFSEVAFRAVSSGLKINVFRVGVSMLMMPPVPKQRIRWIWKYTRILCVHSISFHFFSNPVLPQLWERTSLGFCLSKWFFWLSYSIRARSRTWESTSVQKGIGQNPTVL